MDFRIRRIVLLLAIFITGLCSLGYQTVWQKYLSVLVGSEARSTTIIVAIFLLGLALGYFIFGRYSETIKSRKKLLKNYGFIELATGAYAIFFPTIFDLVFNSPIAQYNNLFLHIFLTFLLLIFPTILMGATIPIMTAVLPEKSEDINAVHSFIYGLNTLGAFLGVIVTAGYLINHFGFDLTIINLGFLNVLVSLVYIGNNLSGDVNEKDSIEIVKNNFSSVAIYWLALVVGAVSICLEMLWIRITGLTIGSGYFVFGLILSIYILGIGLGSLTLKDLSAVGFRKLLVKTCLFIALPFFCVPYLPLVVSNLRVLFIKHSVAFYFFHMLTYILFSLILVPGVFYLGRILPYAFSMIDKDENDYSFKCGVVYFLNTIGTFLGAVIFGYILFYVFQVEQIYRLCLSLLFLTFSYFLYKEKNFKSLGIVGITLIFVYILPFSRMFHEVGLFREREPTDVHFKNIFKATNQKEDRDVLFFEDGPNTTVTVGYSEEDKSKVVMVNGKSDGNTRGDYSTTALVALLPYAQVSGNDLDAAVVGIGTGITPGILSALPRIKSVDVLEISNAIIKTLDILAPENLNFHKSKKVQIYNRDAFQFFKINKNKNYEIIISEPSNPWVWGVENLYTNYFYSLAKRRMAKNGVFVQWLHTYSSSDEMFISIIKNLKSSFKYINLYHTLPGDIALVASDNLESVKINEQRGDEFFAKILSTLNLQKVEQLEYLNVYNHREIDAIVSTNETFEHKIFAPLLSYKGYKEFFLGNKAVVSRFLNPYYSRIINAKHEEFFKKGAFDYIKNLSCSKNSQEKLVKYNLPCIVLRKVYSEAIKLYDNGNLEERLMAYSILRKEKVIKMDESFLEEAYQAQQALVTNDSRKAQKIFSLIIGELNKEGLFAKSSSLILKEEALGNIPKEISSIMLGEIKRIKESIGKLTLKH